MGYHKKNISRVSLFVCCGIFVILSSTGLAATYYVDANAGNDSNPGTQASPWKTVAKVNASSLIPGDFIYFKRGTIWSEGLVPKSGTSINPITYGAYGSGTNPVLDNCNMSNRNYVVLQDMAFRSGRTTPILMFTTTHSIIKNCEATALSGNDNTWAAIYMRYSSAYNQIIDSTIARLSTTGQGDGFAIDTSDYNLVEGNTLTTASHYSLAVYSGRYNIIRNNAFRNDLGGNADIIAAPSGPSCDHNVFDGNTLVGGSKNSFNASSVGLELDNSYNIVRRNIIRDNSTSGAIALSIGAGGNYPNKGNRIYNNVLKSFASWGVQVMAISQYITDLIFKNNIIYSNGSGEQIYNWQDANLTDYHFSGNIIFYPNQSAVIRILNAYHYSVEQSQTSLPANFSQNIQSDPGLDNTYQPLAGSRCIDSGVQLTYVTSPTGSGTSFTVEDANYFMDGFGLVAGDQIRVGRVIETIKSIDYATNQITVSQPISWTNGAGVSLPYLGAAPDIGAIESGEPTPLEPPRNLRIL